MCSWHWFVLLRLYSYFHYFGLISFLFFLTSEGVCFHDWMSRVPPLSLASQRPSTFQLWSLGSCWFCTQQVLFHWFWRIPACVCSLVSAKHPPQGPLWTCRAYSSASSSSSASLSSEPRPPLSTWAPPHLARGGRQGGKGERPQGSPDCSTPRRGGGPGSPVNERLQNHVLYISY